MFQFWPILCFCLVGLFSCGFSSPLESLQIFKNGVDQDKMVKIFNNFTETQEELANLTAILIESSFGKQGLARRDPQKQWHSDGSRMSIDCFCEVTINGLHHTSAEDSVCGARGRTSCDSAVGCQKASAYVKGSHYSIIKSCGDYELSRENCRQHREQDPHMGQQIVVQRCFCHGALCNRAPTTNYLTSFFLLIVFPTLLQ